MVANSTLYRTAGTLGAATLGVRNPLWTPALLPSVVDYWDADVSLATTGSNVNSWTGQLGNVLVSAAAKPTAEGSMNGHIPVRFTASRYMVTPALVAGVDQLYYFAFKVTTLDTTTQQALGYFNSTGHPTIYLRAGGNWMQAYFSTGNIATSTSPLTTGTHVLVIHKASEDGLYKMRLDGLQVASGAGSMNTNPNGGRLGQYSAGSSPLLDTSIGALGIAAGPKALADVQKLEGYLAHRFGSAGVLPMAHPFKASAPRQLD